MRTSGGGSWIATRMESPAAKNNFRKARINVSILKLRQ